MTYGFWEKLDRPIMILAPMANVTDWAFRDIVTSCGKPDVFYTEFLSCDGILHDQKRFEKELYFQKEEKPIVVQFFGSKPENFYQCAQLAQKLGFDGIDINMGCPDKSVEKQGGGASLIKNPELAVKIIKETIRGSGKLPVSVKTRLGYNKIEIEEWIPRLLDTGISALTIHGRTRKEMSSVPAQWDKIGEVEEMARSAGSGQAKGSGVLIIGNGDVMSLVDAKEKAQKYNLDGIMVGRGIFANPWFFSGREVGDPKERIKLLKKHVENSDKLWGDGKNFDTLKRFFKVYIQGWPGAKDLRTELMMTKNRKGVFSVLEKLTHS